MKLTSHLALASQLLAASVGLSVLPVVASAQTDAPAIEKMSKADRELTAKIRKAVVGDKSLSVAAHNVHIAAQDGTVTLRGSVKTEEEKKSVEDKAKQIAGDGKVTSELTVGSETSSQ